MKTKQNIEVVMRIDILKVMKLVNGGLSLKHKPPGSQSIPWSITSVVDILSCLNFGYPDRGAWDKNKVLIPYVGIGYFMNKVGFDPFRDLVRNHL